MSGPRWLNKLERKFGKFAIPNLMGVLVFGMAIVFLIDTFINPDYQFNLSSILYFDRELILQGQIWRIITFIFLPPESNLFFIIFALYFYWMIGSGLERQWGAFRFNVFYFIGVVANIIAGFITGYALNTYLNLTLFLAFAMLYPNFRVLLFFFIPIKIKWLGWLDAVLLAASLIFNTWTGRAAILFSILNFIVFFGKDLLYSVKMFFRRIGNKRRRGEYNGDNTRKTWKNHWWDDNNNNPFNR